MRPVRVDPDWKSEPPSGTVSARFFCPENIEERRPNEVLDPPHFVDLPEVIVRKLGGTSVRYPAHFVAKLRQARVFSHHGVIISPDNRVFDDLTHEFRDFQLGNRVCHYAGLPDVEKIDTRLLAIPTVSCWKNYFHWMVDAVPRLRAMDPSEYDHVLTPLSRPYHSAALEALGIPRSKWIAAEASTHLAPTQLIVPSYPKPGHPTPEAVQFIRQSFDLPVRTGNGRRIYISRGDAWRRRVRNEQALMEQLEPLGFEMVTMDGLDLAAQARLFANIEFVISSHGAALTNLIFSQPRTKILECYPSDFIYPHFYRLSAAAGHIYSAHTSHCEPEDPDLDLEIDSLIPCVERLMAAS